MSYLLGDSTDSGLDFNYLELTKDVVECAAVLVEAELELGATIDKRRERESERAADIRSVEELGQQATAVVASIAKEQADAPAGRCATAIVAAVKDAVDRETGAARAALASDLGALDKADDRVRMRNRDVLEKLLRAHDLPTVEKTYEIVWTANAVEATMRERATFGVEAMLALEIPSSSALGVDLRVDRLVEGVEIHVVEVGGWLKKADKLVPHKLGRYHITRVAVGSGVTVRLQATAEPSSIGFTITVRGDDEALLVERHGDGAKEFQIEDSDKPRLCQLAVKLEQEVRALDASRAELVSVLVDGKPIAEHAHPRELAERLIKAIAPTVQKIARHSRSPGELVLRRLLGGNRREELFISTSELVKLFARLPESARDVFAPLELDGKPYVAPTVDAKSEPTTVEATKPAARPRPPTAQKLTAERSAPRTVPPIPPPGPSSTEAEPTRSGDDLWEEPK